MTFPTFEAMQSGYSALWQHLEIRPEHADALHELCLNLISHKTTYQGVSAIVWGKPDFWFVVALLDAMEHDPERGLCNCHLHNGDSLEHRTVNVPPGRPPAPLMPPFTFQESAVDSLRFQGFDKITSWPVERVAYEFEKYNGEGYLDKPIENPYLASWSNMYTRGKYVRDHVYDPNAVSGQPGALTILKVLVSLDSSVAAAIGVPAQAKEPTVPTDATAKPDILAQIEQDVELAQPIITMILGIIPNGQMAVPFVPLIEAGLKLADQIAKAPDLASKFDAIETGLQTFAGHIGPLKAVFAPPTKAAPAA